MRTYVVDLAGGTVTQTVQISERGTLKKAVLSFLSAAVGKIEISLLPSSQIGTAQPPKGVLARLNCSATAGNVNVTVDLPPTAVKPFDSIYIHQTGAGNVGSATLFT